MSIPKIYRIIDQKGSIPMSHIWDHARHQEWPKNPGSSNKRFAWSSRGLFGRLVWRFQLISTKNCMYLVAKLFTIFTRTCSGSYAISWLECRQTNMFDAKTVILYWTSNITNVHSTTVPMWNPCWSINGHKSNTSTSTLKAACATPYKGISGALWEGNHLSEQGCPLAGATGHAY